jgi:hypothetical protein
LTTRRARAVTYGVVALLAGLVIHATDGRSTSERPPAREEVAPAAPAADSVATRPAASPSEREDTLGRGETITSVLARGGVSDVIMREVLRAASMLDMRRIPAGMRVVTRAAHPDSSPSEIVFFLSQDRKLRLRRSGTAWEGAEERTPWRTDTVVVSGTIRSSLYEAMQTASRGTLSPPRASS